MPNTYTDRLYDISVRARRKESQRAYREAHKAYMALKDKTTPYAQAILGLRNLHRRVLAIWDEALRKME